MDGVDRDEETEEEGDHEHRSACLRSCRLDNDLEERQLASEGRIKILHAVDQGDRDSHPGDEAHAHSRQERERDCLFRLLDFLDEVDGAIKAGVQV